MRKAKPLPSVRDLTPEQAAALVEFAEKYGPQWKDKLRESWMKAGCYGFPQYHFLHQIRNQHGPSWLEGFTFTH